MNNLRFISLLLLSIYCLLAISCEKEDGFIKPDTNIPCEPRPNEQIRFKFIETCKDTHVTDTLSDNVESFEFSVDSILVHSIYGANGSTQSVNRYDLKEIEKELKLKNEEDRENMEQMLRDYCREQYEDSLLVDICFQDIEKVLGIQEQDLSLARLVQEATGRLIMDIKGDTSLVYYDTKRTRIPCPTSEINYVYRIEKEERKPLYPYTVDNWIFNDHREYKLPLLPNETQSTFVFESKERTDTLVFNYQSVGYQSESCGTRFLFEDIEVEQCTFEWYEYNEFTQLITTKWE